MAWLPKGNCYAFHEDFIAAYAPEATGVYGLYNSGYQLYIGVSSNIRAALLLHIGEAECQSARYQPTGFAFEVCSGELRAAKTEQLIAEHCPVRQTEWPRADSWEADTDRQKEFPFVFSSPAEQSLDGADLVVPASETPFVVRKRYYSSRVQVAMLTVLFALSLTTIFFLAIFTGESVQKRASAGYETPLVDVSDKAPSGQSGTITSSVVEQNLLDEAAKSNSKLPAQKSTSSRPARVSGKDISWAVQLAANRVKTVTEGQVLKLKAKGYDGYMVETDRDGQIWYRVRVGRFNTRAEAEALREILESRDSYRSPFITND